MIEHAFVTDRLSRPRGGSSRGNGVAIEWEDAPGLDVPHGASLGQATVRAVVQMGPDGVGATVRDVIQCAVERLEFLTGAPLPPTMQERPGAQHDQWALGHLRQALAALDDQPGR